MVALSHLFNTTLTAGLDISMADWQSCNCILRIHIIACSLALSDVSRATSVGIGGAQGYYVSEHSSISGSLASHIAFTRAKPLTSFIVPRLFTNNRHHRNYVRHGLWARFSHMAPTCTLF